MSQEPESAAPSSNAFVRLFLRVAEVGNRLPDPLTLFIILAVIVVLISAIFDGATADVVQRTGKVESKQIMSLLSVPGLRWMLSSAVDNFIKFPPLGPVLAVMLGIGVAERAGFITMGLRLLVRSVPASFLTATLVFAGVMSSMVADAGYVVLTPLGAVLFAGIGRHPIAGLAAAFAGVSGGFSANLFITGLDPLLSNLTKAAAAGIDPAYAAGIDPTANYFFMVASVFLITIIGTIITTRVVEPMLGEWDPSFSDLEEEDTPEEPTDKERRAFGRASLAGAATVLVGLALILIPASTPPAGNALVAVSSPNAEELSGDKPFEVNVSLNSSPQAPVTFTIATSNPKAATVTPASLTFEPKTFARDQTLTITPVGDALRKNKSKVSVTLTPKDKAYTSAVAPIILADPMRGMTVLRDPIAHEDDPKKTGTANTLAWISALIKALGPLFGSIEVLIALLFLIPGVVYGVLTGRIKNDKDIAKMASATMATMGAYIVLAFVAGQFVAYFNHTNLGPVSGVKGAELLQSLGLTGIPLLLTFVFVSSLMNLFVGSASAKWAFMAPVFVPMLMLSGLSPELVQAGYRVGDSVTNIISPLMPYLPIIIVFAQKYDRRAGLGTIISAMLPYSMAFAAAWTVMLIFWMVLGIPLGPDAPLYYTAP